MKNNEDPQDEDARKEKQEQRIVSEELIRWMTEGTSPNLTPRSDCG
jgi:hypothetical protein